MSATQDWIDMGVRLTRLEAFDKDAVVRFFNDVLNRRTFAETDARHAAVLLMALMQGVHAGEDIAPAFRRLLKVRKLRKNKFDPRSAYIDSTAFDIVVQLERGKITLREAIDAFSEHVVEADEKSIRAWIKAIRPRARNIAELWQVAEQPGTREKK